MKTWKPDTCDCVVEELYNGTEIIGGGAVLKKCDAHASVPDDQLYGVLYANPDGENKRKNRIESILLGGEGQNFNLHETVTNSDGSVTVKWKGGVTFSWAWTGTGAGRTLNITVTGVNLTTNQKNTINNIATTRFGAGKVVIT
jgi:hypothetical protein